MMNKERQKASRIPVHFVEEENLNAASENEADGGGELTPEEIGRESSYEDETEVQRRIDRGGAEDEESADESDVAGGPPLSELPERREDQDTNPSHRESDEEAREAAGEEKGQEASAEGGPHLAELVATRAELKRVDAELKKLSDERHDLLDKLRRHFADFENYRKRVERDRAETYNRVVSDVVSQLLPVIDNLRRALDAEKSVETNESEEFRHFLHGVELINRQLNGVLENLGVKPVETVGQPFDPHVHEAVATEESEEYDADVVSEELVRGYTLGDKLIRPAMVKVAK